MKRILMLAALTLSFLASEAQAKRPTTKKIKSPKISSEAIYQAKQDSLVAQRQQKIDSAVAYQLQYDSIRKEDERLAYEKFQKEQADWKENKLKELDSSNKESWKMLSKEHEERLEIEKQRAELNKSARLTEYQKIQVKYINQTSFDRAKEINADNSITGDQKNIQLVKLNQERKTKIRTIVGKSKQRKLENARKAQNNTKDLEAQWIIDAEGYAKN